MVYDEDCRTAVLGKTERTVGWEGDGDPIMTGLVRHCHGKPAATDRPCLPSLSHSFTLDFVVLCNGTKAEAHAMKEKLKELLSTMGLTLSGEKTRVTHITDGFNFLGYRIIRGLGTKGKMVSKVLVPKEAMDRFRHKIREMLAP
jgi:hypothetical protein